MRAETTHGGGIVSLMRRRRGVLHRGLWGVLSVTKGFDFTSLPPICISIHPWSCRSPRTHSHHSPFCSIYPDHTSKQDHTGYFKVTLAYYFSSFLNRIGSALTTSFSLLPQLYCNTSSRKVLFLIRGFWGCSGDATVPPCGGKGNRRSKRTNIRSYYGKLLDNKTLEKEM